MIHHTTYKYNKLIFLFAMGLHFFCSGQSYSDLPHGVQGIWNQNAPETTHLSDWKAQWIWLPYSIQNHVILARKSFNLQAVPKTSKLRISATSKYQLYVNDHYICQGPARSAPHHQSFDILNISSLLRTGKNTIAVRAHYQNGTMSYHLKGRGGLLVQLDLEERSTPKLISDTSWKVFPDLSWNNHSEAISRFQLVVNDDIDFNKKQKNFYSINFNDDSWYSARPLLRNSGWPSPKPDEKGTTLTTPWTSLVLRDIPYLKESDIKATQLIEARKLNESYFSKNEILLNNTIQKPCSKDFSDYQKGSKPIMISPSEAGTSSFLLFDLGTVANGQPKLSIEGPKNTKIHILTAPYMIDGKFTHKIVASNYHDQLTLSGKKDVWEAMYFKPARYIALIVEAHSDPVKFHFIGTHKIQYPFQLKGSLSTPSAPWLEALWNASVKTIDVCTTDALTDNYRERRQYAQTGYYATLGNYFSYGDFTLQKRCLTQVAQEQEGNGLMPAYAPLTGDDYMVILDSNCLWIRSLHNYLLYSGDYKTAKALLPAARKLMTLLHTFTNTLGMIDNPPYAYWLDHALNDRQGANLCLNGHYLGALQDFSKLLKWTNNIEESAAYKKKARLLKQSLTLFWDDKKELFADAYIDGRRSKQFSEHGNAMALAYNIATPKQGDIIARKLLEKDNHNYIKRENGLTMVTPAMSYFLHKGIANYGHEEASLNMLYDRFKKMLDTNTNQTLWEEWWRDGTGRNGKFFKRTRSDAQTESAFHPSLFADLVLGITITKPGFKEVLIKSPNVSISNNASSIIPTPQGDFYISWILSKKNKELHMKVPRDMSVKLHTESFKNHPIKTVFKNSKATQFHGNANGYIILSSGDFLIQF